MLSRLSLRSAILALVAAAIVAVLASYRFALAYRRRAGRPHPRPILVTPDDLGLPYESVTIPTPNGALPGWLVPDASATVAPGIVIVHGWESNRGAGLPHVQFLRPAGFHCLVFDVRGHGDNAPEALPLTTAEFAADAAAAAAWLAGRPEVSRVGVIGHSLGGAGAIIAAAREPAIEAVVATSTPADPRRLTRQTFRLAGLPFPGPIAEPLAWLTTRVLLLPRRHSIAEVSASAAVRRYWGPLLLVHGQEDTAIPVQHLDRLARAATAARRGSEASAAAPVETLVLPGFGHRWLYLSPTYRRTVAGFLARSLGGPDPETAGQMAVSALVIPPPSSPDGFGALGGRAAAVSGDSRPAAAAGA